MKTFIFSLLILFSAAGASAADYPAVVEGDFVLKDFKFASGETLPALRIHYRTLGTPVRNAEGKVSNAVLLIHNTSGDGGIFINPQFGGELFGPGAALDATRYYIIAPDAIGHGRSGKPSDGLRARFPRYGYTDMVDAQHRLLVEGLGVQHLRLVLGTSMGGMHAWIWGERYPAFMDALMPLSSLPVQTAGRNRVWRRVLIDAIRNDAEWRGGAYTAQPPSLKTALQLLYFMSSNPILRQEKTPTLEGTDADLDAFVGAGMKRFDATDLLYQLEASRDYDPAPGLEKIRAPLLALNTADDLVNPPELGILEREIKRVAKGRAILLPLSPATRGHGGHTVAALWKEHLKQLMADSATTPVSNK
ncbi:MAG: alpha/beta fold hydrolase [Pseudomonadota bacterium]